jgi:hypothetical protein
MHDFQSLLNEGLKISKGLSKLAINTSSAIANNKKIISPEHLAQERLDICNKCENLEKNLDRCSVCGCFVKVKTKVSFEECPLHKW